jgi:hypothetical protein
MTSAVRPRRSVRIAAVAAVALLAGVLPGANSSATGGEGELSLAYTCRFGAAGQDVQDVQDVTISFSQAYPHGGRVGKPVQPGELTMTVGISRGAVAALLPAPADTLTGTGDLKALVTQGGSQAHTDWPGLRADSTAVAGGGDLLIAFTGTVPGVSVTAPGDVAFAVGDATLTLRPQAAAGTPAPPTSAPPTSPSASPSAPATGATPSATAPAAAVSAVPSDAGATPTVPAAGGTAAPLPDVTGLCTATSGQDTTLAHVAVTGGGPGGTAGPTTPGQGGTAPAGSSASAPRAGSPSGKGGTVVPLQQPAHSHVTTCGKVPVAPLDPKRLPPVSATAIVLPMPGQPPFPPVSQCAFAVGFSNVNKLNGAMIVNDPQDRPQLAEVNSGQRKVLDFGNQYVEVDSIIALQLPPSHSTFLTYGFVPTTAEVDFVPKGVMTVVQTGDDFFDQPILTTIGGYQAIRIHDVKVNGTPLDVGPDCRTATPIDVVLKGRKDEQVSTGGDGRPDYDIQDGGPLVDDNMVIPPFTGCGSHGENLDALFTAAISGPGNTLNLSQGRICDPANAPQLCLPEIQLPQLPQRR